MQSGIREVSLEANACHVHLRKRHGGSRAWCFVVSVFIHAANECLFVWEQFQGGVWTLNMPMCDGLMTMDVMLCTASIFNLCAISVDRYVGAYLVTISMKTSKILLQWSFSEGFRLKVFGN